MHRPNISVIIVSYNTAELTLKSVRSAYDSSGFKPGEIEVIVVDNASTDDTVKRLGSELDNFRLIINSPNVGFGSANNQGASAARGKYLLFLNSDAFLEPGTLSSLVTTMDTHKAVYSAAPQLRDVNGTIQPSAGYFPTPSRLLGWMLGLDKLPLVKPLFFSTPYHVFDLSWYTKAQSPDWLMGACIMFRKTEFWSVKGFDEQIFMYGEEVDLYLRLAQKLSKKVSFDPTVYATHLGRSSSTKAATNVLIEEIKGIEHIYARHYPSYRSFARLVIKLGVLLRIAIYSMIPSRAVSVLEYKKLL